MTPCEMLTLTPLAPCVCACVCVCSQYNGSFVYGKIVEGGPIAPSGATVHDAAFGLLPVVTLSFIRATNDSMFPVSTSVAWAVGAGPSVSSGVAASQVRTFPATHLAKLSVCDWACVARECFLLRFVTGLGSPAVPSVCPFVSPPADVGCEL